MKNRLGESLVNGLVETDDVHEHRVFGEAGLHPEGQYAGAERSVFRGKLLNVEPRLRPEHGMDLRGGFRGRDRGGGEAHGFRRLLLGGLGRPQVRSNCLEDFLRMIAQLQRHHVACRWQAGGREGLPFAQDPLHVADDEIGKSHDGPDSCLERETNGRKQSTGAQLLVVRRPMLCRKILRNRLQGTQRINGSPYRARECAAGAQPSGSEVLINLLNNGIRVLVVDDNIDQVTMLSGALRHAGYIVQSAHTGPEGLQVALQWRPHIVVLDIGLPGLNGYEISRHLRSNADTKSVRLIALTGYAKNTDIALACEAGFDAHLSKPLEFDELEKLLSRTDVHELISE